MNPYIWCLLPNSAGDVQSSAFVGSSDNGLPANLIGSHHFPDEIGMYHFFGQTHKSYLCWFYIPSISVITFYWADPNFSRFNPCYCLIMFYLIWKYCYIDDYGLLVKQLITYNLSLSHDVVLIHKTKSMFLFILSKTRLHHVLLGLSSILKIITNNWCELLFQNFFFGWIHWLPEKTLAIHQLWWYRGHHQPPSAASTPSHYYREIRHLPVSKPVVTSHKVGGCVCVRACVCVCVCSVMWYSIPRCQGCNKWKKKISSSFEGMFVCNNAKHIQMCCVNGWDFPASSTR